MLSKTLLVGGGGKREMLDIAVVGCGYWGPNLIRNFNSLTGACVVAVCDNDEARLNHMRTLYPNVETTRDFKEILANDQVEAIVIATPVSRHHEMGMASLEAGKHTFIEKPMARSSKECVDLIKGAEDRNLTLMVGHTFVYTSVVNRIKEIIDAGDLGEILYISARRLNLGLFQDDINVAWDLAPHDISIILYLLSEKPIGINCQGKCHIRKGIEDVTNMSLAFKNGKFATIQSSWLDPNKVREMTIVGSRRMLVYDDLAQMEKIKIYDKRVEIPPHYDTFAEFHYSYHYGDVYSPYLNQIEPLKVECQHFIDCIEKKETPRSSGMDGLDVVQILEASDKSLKNGGGQIPIESNSHQFQLVS